MNTDKATILAILKTQPDYRPPRPMNPNRPPNNRYCEFHDDTGHDMERCFQLTSLIEDKIKEGNLKHYVDRNEARKSIPRDSDRVIDVILGGYSAGGGSNNAKKLYAREICCIKTKSPRKNPTPIISYSDEDFLENMIEGNQDALVITAKIGANNVKKVLIDNDSSVDILYYSAYSRMDLEDRKIDNAKTSPLHGFTGNEVKVIGTIDMPVLFGSSPCQSWQIVKVHVVNATSSYNAILGRTTITAITSITHLKMKFPTKFGVRDVCGDQRDSRQCYLSNAIPKKHSANNPDVNQVIKVDPKEVLDVPKDSYYEPNEALEEIQLFEGNAENMVKIGANLTPTSEIFLSRLFKASQTSSLGTPMICQLSLSKWPCIG